MSIDEFDDDDGGRKKPPLRLVGNKTPRRRSKSVKPISRSAPGALAKLKNCRCFPELDRRLRLGWATSDLATMVQEEYGECKDVAVKYLQKLIDTYRKAIPSAELAISSSNSLVARNAIKRVAEGLDELKELERLYQMQVERIGIDVENEKKINKLFPGTGREIFIAMKLVNQSAQLKMDLGLLKRQMGSVEMTGALAADVGQRYGKDSLGKVVADPDSRRKVLGLVEKFVTLGAKASLDAVDILGQAYEGQASEDTAPENSKDVIDVTPTEPPPGDKS